MFRVWVWAACVSAVLCALYHDLFVYGGMYFCMSVNADVHNDSAHHTRTLHTLSHRTRVSFFYVGCCCCSCCSAAQTYQEHERKLAKMTATHCLLSEYTIKLTDPSKPSKNLCHDFRCLRLVDVGLCFSHHSSHTPSLNWNLISMGCWEKNSAHEHKNHEFFS